uniref:PIN domain-containing protein n=1 Tax=Pyrodinium bahamense TaxID=73915 RepID=A0A7S0B6G6_9DINO|mmetsp:Transcript_51045/g.141348  ORF Transcript_51045/g.141348 Transcript_51045/m.141348 type:complete len:208 (+) Transcript_51045:50-673(+)
MGKKKDKKKLRKFQQGLAKRRINENDDRFKEGGKKVKKDKVKKQEIREVPKVHSSLFFQYNTNLRPPYQILLDTNFINMSIQMKLDVFKASMDCLLAKCVPCITDCVMGELEKMGTRHRLALRLAKDQRFQRLTCQHRGTYADDCIFDRVQQHKIYIVATNDKDLKRRIRKVPGVPIMYVVRGMYKIERIPEQIDNVPLRSNKGKGG